MLTWENKAIHQLFYLVHFTINQNHYVLDSFESRHLIKVLRKKKGDVIFGTDGKGRLLMAERLTRLNY